MCVEGEQSPLHICGLCPCGPANQLQARDGEKSSSFLSMCRLPSLSSVPDNTAWCLFLQHLPWGRCYRSPRDDLGDSEAVRGVNANTVPSAVGDLGICGPRRAWEGSAGASPLWNPRGGCIWEP